MTTPCATCGHTSKADGPDAGSLHVDAPLGSAGKPKKKPAGAFVKSDAHQRYTLGPVYEPMVEDSQGDFASAAEIEQACWDFNKRLQHQDAMTKAALATYDTLTKAAAGESVTVMLPGEPIEKGMLGIQHAVWDDSFGDIIESYIAPCDMVVDGEPIRKGTWLLGVIWSEAVFAKILKGEITGYSMGGSATKRRVATIT